MASARPRASNLGASSVDGLVVEGFYPNSIVLVSCPFSGHGQIIEGVLFYDDEGDEVPQGDPSTTTWAYRARIH